MRATTLILIAATACGLSQRRWEATPAQMAPPPLLRDHVTSAIGPLALEPGAGTTPWPAIQSARKITDDHYLDRERIREETATVLTLIDTFYRPLTAETRIGFEQAHRSLSSLERLAPYSISNVALAFQQSTDRLNLCVRNAGVMAPCARDLTPRPVRTRPGPFVIGLAATGIGLLTVRDLRDADDPAWQGFGAAARTLADMRGLVIDLRDAIGADPRAMLPWALAVSRRTALAPLRAIERPAAAAPYVEAYRARFTDHGRDPAIWRPLLAETKPAAPTAGGPTKQPIAILVGPSCEAACELIARVLETYAGAIVIGGVARSGRLARDEPAMVFLPHSQTSVYFLATRYLLAAEIEAATGPTEEWHALGGDGPDPGATAPPGGSRATDHLTFAIRDVRQRIEHPGGWPRCDSMPVAAPAADTAKLQGLAYLAASQSCPGGLEITVQSDVPASALRRYFATCAVVRGQISSSSYVPGRFSLRITQPTPTLLAQIAASELVQFVTVKCQAQVYINKAE